MATKRQNWRREERPDHLPKSQAILTRDKFVLFLPAYIMHTHNDERQSDTDSSNSRAIICNHLLNAVRYLPLFRPITSLMNIWLYLKKEKKLLHVRYRFWFSHTPDTRTHPYVSIPVLGIQGVFIPLRQGGYITHIISKITHTATSNP